MESTSSRMDASNLSRDQLKEKIKFALGRGQQFFDIEGITDLNDTEPILPEDGRMFSDPSSGDKRRREIENAGYGREWIKKWKTREEFVSKDRNQIFINAVAGIIMVNPDTLRVPPDVREKDFRQVERIERLRASLLRKGGISAAARDAITKLKKSRVEATAAVEAAVEAVRELKKVSEIIRLKEKVLEKEQSAPQLLNYINRIFRSLSGYYGAAATNLPMGAADSRKQKVDAIDFDISNLGRGAAEAPLATYRQYFSSQMNGGNSGFLSSVAGAAEFIVKLYDETHDVPNRLSFRLPPLSTTDIDRVRSVAAMVASSLNQLIQPRVTVTMTTRVILVLQYAKRLQAEMEVVAVEMKIPRYSASINPGHRSPIIARGYHNATQFENNVTSVIEKSTVPLLKATVEGWFALTTSMMKEDYGEISVNRMQQNYTKELSGVGVTDVDRIRIAKWYINELYEHTQEVYNRLSRADRWKKFPWVAATEKKRDNPDILNESRRMYFETWSDLLELTIIPEHRKSLMRVDEKLTDAVSRNAAQLEYQTVMYEDQLGGDRSKIDPIRHSAEWMQQEENYGRVMPNAKLLSAIAMSVEKLITQDVEFEKAVLDEDTIEFIGGNQAELESILQDSLMIDKIAYIPFASVVAYQIGLNKDMWPDQWKRKEVTRTTQVSWVDSFNALRLNFRMEFDRSKKLFVFSRRPREQRRQKHARLINYFHYDVPKALRMNDGRRWSATERQQKYSNSSYANPRAQFQQWRGRGS